MILDILNRFRKIQVWWFTERSALGWEPTLGREQKKYFVSLVW